VLTQKDGRRNRYQIQAHLPGPEPGTREPAVREVAALFAARNRSSHDSWITISGNILLVLGCVDKLRAGAGD
jgi:hypothetical protein